MSISKTTSFINDLFIPLAKATISGTVNTESPNNNVALQSMIDVVEKDILVNALGLTLYNELQTALLDLPNADQKWKDLVNGVEYDGKIWEGLDNPKSLLLYAVYYFFLSDNSAGFYTAVGISKPNSENSQLVTPAYKLATAWQTFLLKYQKGLKLCPDITYKNGVEFVDWFGNDNDVNQSLYQYLTDKAIDFGWDASKFRVYENVNTFGI